MESSYLNKEDSIPFGWSPFLVLHYVTISPDFFGAIHETAKRLKADIAEASRAARKWCNYHIEYVLTSVGNGHAEYFRGSIVSPLSNACGESGACRVWRGRLPRWSWPASRERGKRLNEESTARARRRGGRRWEGRREADVSSPEKSQREISWSDYKVAFTKPKEVFTTDLSW